MTQWLTRLEWSMEYFSAIIAILALAIQIPDSLSRRSDMLSGVQVPCWRSWMRCLYSWFLLCSLRHEILTTGFTSELTATKSGFQIPFFIKQRPNPEARGRRDGLLLGLIEAPWVRNVSYEWLFSRGKLRKSRISGALVMIFSWERVERWEIVFLFWYL